MEPVTVSSGHRFHVSMKVLEVIDPWFSYKPLDLYLTFGASVWVWHDVDLSVQTKNATPAESLHAELLHPPTIEQRRE